MFNKKSLTSLLAIFFLISSCSSLSPSADGVLSGAQSKIFQDNRFNLEDLPTVENQKAQNYLQKILQNILSHYQIKKNIRVEIVDTLDAQGSSDIQRRIYVSRGMLYAIQNEAELVAILGHEVGHIQLGHLQPQDSDQSSEASDFIKNVIENTSGVEIPESFEQTIKNLYYSQYNQQKEQEADKFGEQVSIDLGYNPYAFVSLLQRLDGLADKSFSAHLKNIFGTHKTLGDRADDLLQDLKARGIKNWGVLGGEDYLKNVSSLAGNNKPATPKTSKQLQNLLLRVQSRAKNPQPLSIREFLSFMQELRGLSKDAGILSQIYNSHRDSSKNLNELFMMEVVKVLMPWWSPSAQTLATAGNILETLGKMGVSSIPYVGNAINFYEVLEGKDFYTNKELSFGERVASAIGVVANAGKNWHAIDEDLEGLGKKAISANEKEIEEVAKVTDEAIERVAPIIEKSDKSVAELQKDYRLLGSEENHEKLTALADKLVNKDMPDDWKVKLTVRKDGKFQGLEYLNPENNQFRLRVMPGEPTAKWPNSRIPYVIQKTDKGFIDKFGNVVKDSRNEAVHIPLEDFNFKDFWSKYGF